MGRDDGLGKLVEHGTKPLSDTTAVVNPAWRRLDQAARRERALLTRAQAQFGGLSPPSGAPPETVSHYEQEP